MATDPFRDSILVNVWSMVEINVAICCASAPALKPIFSLQRLLDSRKQSSRSYPGVNKSGSSKQGIEVSTSQSHIVTSQSGEHSTSPRTSSQSPEDIELEHPRHPQQAHT
ncbi:hypothetical protein F5B20DRAFT_194159 [Whalleya microplaca]|nr:hypothetical protein F5B20DRAFT_194159 [Whalleya microplaca]